MSNQTSTTKTAEDFEQDFKELSIYLDVLCKNGHDVKDAGHTWIAFTDKFANFRKRILAAVNQPSPSISDEEIEAIGFTEWVTENGWEYKIRVYEDVLWYEPTQDLARSTKELYSLYLSR
jgi:hypothetical protein